MSATPELPASSAPLMFVGDRRRWDEHYSGDDGKADAEELLHGLVSSRRVVV